MNTIRLRPGVHYAPIDGGVFFSSARATFVMRGPAVLFRVVDTCLPLLEDGTRVDDLVIAMATPAARPLVTHLVDTFDSRGLVLHLDQLVVPEPGAEERERFPETLAYLETYRDDPYADFRRIRTARVLLAGPSDALGPAARGLVRAGAGQVLVATTEPERLAALASRQPEVQLLPQPGDDVATLIGDVGAQAAVIFTEDSFPFDAVARVPATCATIPVRLGKDLAIVGPALRGDASPRGVERLWSRAAAWCRLDGDELLVRPSGDLLAGALAGQVAVDALIGLNPGRVHLVHGPDLGSDSMAPVLTADAAYDAPTELEGPPSDAHPPAMGGGALGQDGEAADDSLDWLESASRRWAGLFRVSVPGDLPQMPVALTLADGRSGRLDGRAVGFGPDQQASTTEAGLEALRRHCAAQARSEGRIGPEGPEGPESPHGPVAAAGLDQTSWLLDGALRLLATLPGDERPVEWLGIDDMEACRLWRAVEEHELTPVGLSECQVPEFGWVRVSVRDRRSGSLLARQWGPTAAIGAIAALSSAIATQQVRRTVDPGYTTATAGPGFLDHLHGPHVDELAAAVRAWLAANRRRLRGRRLRRDPVAGPLGAWCGTVWLDG